MRQNRTTYGWVGVMHALVCIAAAGFLLLSSGCARQRRMEAALVEKQKKVDLLAKQNKRLVKDRQDLTRTNAFLRAQVKQLERTVRRTSGYSEAMQEIRERDQAIEKARLHIRKLNHQIRRGEEDVESMERQVQKMKEQLDKARSQKR